MPQNPFNQTLDWTVQGKYARVTVDVGRVFKGGSNVSTTIGGASSCTM